MAGTGDSIEDPTQISSWRELRLLQAAMDAEIERIYVDDQIYGLKPTWVMELLRLHFRGPMTITELAESVERTHSALSQKVAAMREAGWVTTTPGTDARSKKVTLTPKAAGIIRRLAAEWRATEAAMAEIQAEIPYPISRVVTDMRAALARRSFHDRIAARLAADPDWSADPEEAPMSLWQRALFRQMSSTSCIRLASTGGEPWRSVNCRCWSMISRND